MEKQEINQEQIGQAEPSALPPVLPGDVPVTMPELPAHYPINTIHQFKAISDTTRSKILGIVQHQPATAKQIATRLHATPGAIGHHLKVLEEAGLVQIVARRLVRGIVANYYTRTARIFDFDLPPEIGGEAASLDILNSMREQFMDAKDNQEDEIGLMGFPHARLSPDKARSYAARLEAIMNDLLAEPITSDGDVYGIFVSMFRSPAYMQSNSESEEKEA